MYTEPHKLSIDDSDQRVITGNSQRQALHINRDWTYLPGWGCYGRQATLKNGFTDTVWMKLTDGT